MPYAVAVGCNAGTVNHGFTGGGGTGGATGGGGGASVTSSSTGDLGIDASLSDSGGEGGIICTPGGPDDDVDMDGFTQNQGDCDDCDPNVNPNSLEVPTPEGVTPKDENCNGTVDEAVPDVTCDSDLAVAEMDPLGAARAVELCKMSTGPLDWGVVSAKWVMADGSNPPTTAPQATNFHLGHGMLSAFGAVVKVRKGERMLALSSGSARQPTDPGYHSVNGFDKLYTGGNAQGFPKESPACPGTLTGEPHDPTGVEIVINAPSNAKGFSFDFDFFTFEWPNYVCNKYNDFFIAILSPKPMGQTDGNVSFDSMGNPVSVNNALLEVCGCEGNPPNPCVEGGKTFACSLGNTDLIGTGFGFDTDFGQDHGSTGWLQTKAPITPGSQITIRWAVYDSGDGSLDTTTLIDNWRWIANAGVDVGTNPIPQ
ncbi:Cell division protein FtsH [Minicystis rosea]|nr:Cell division protein FtsH [Minicystis rosea]